MCRSLFGVWDGDDQLAMKSSMTIISVRSGFSKGVEELAECVEELAEFTISD